MLVSEMVNQAWGMTPVLPTPLSGNPRQTSVHRLVILPSVQTSDFAISLNMRRDGYSLGTMFGLYYCVCRDS